MHITTVLIPLPLFYNEDSSGQRTSIEDSKFVETAMELVSHFQEGGALWKRPPEAAPHGFWWDRGIVERDVLAFIELDIRDTRANRAWLKRYARDVLLPRFEQRAIYLRFFPASRTVVTEKVTDA